ncbi:MAG: TonB-dependent receptor [Leadbetterella sp.]|nr:TonB-dependent receptor [Leadbetterella sp.]
MKITFPPLFVLLLSFGLTMAAETKGQEMLEKRLSIEAANLELKQLLLKIEKHADVKFSFIANQIPAGEKITFSAENETLGSILNELLFPLHVSYEVTGKYIVLKRELNTIDLRRVKMNLQQYTVSGKVTDNRGEMLVGATVTLSYQKKSLMVGNDGIFSFPNVPNGNYTLTLTSVGYKEIKRDISVNGSDVSINVSMQEDNLQLDQLIVTSSGSAKKKIESSVAITTVSAKQLEERPPLNSTDMLKAIPGMSVESSGGDGPGSVRVRGLPGGGYVFMGVMEDGLPVLPTGYTTNPSPDQLYKVDLTIKNVEAVRGGHAAVILAGTPGALINLLSATGGDRLSGKLKYTRGLSQNANRFDGVIGGPISSKWKYSIGGFYRADDGIRPPTFRANEGGQIKGNLTYNMKNGSYLRFYGKYLNDKTTWLVPSYYSYDGSGQGKALPNFDLLKDILVTRDTKVTLTSPDGRTFNYDFADGVHYKSTAGQVELKINTRNEWTIRNNMRYSVSEGKFTGSTVTAATAYKPAVNYYYLDGQQLVNPTGYYTGQSFTGSESDDRQFVDNLDFHKQFGKHGVSFGLGFHLYDVNAFGLGATFNTEIKDNPRTLRIGNNTGNGYSGVNINNYRDGMTTILSAMLSDEVNFGNLTIDLGVRLDNFRVKGDRLINSTPFTNMTPYDETRLHSTGSLGLNYKINASHALFARATKTYSALNVGNYSAFNYNPDDAKRRDIIMAEVGYKINTQKVGLFGSLVYASLNNIAASMGVPNQTGGIINIGTFASSRNLSAELEAIYAATNNLNFRLTTTVQSSKFTDYEVTAPANARADLAGKPFIWTGNSAERIPNYMAELQATYKYSIFDLFVGYRQIGKRWTTPSNVYRLKGYNEVSAGLDIRVLKNLGLRIWGDNLTNSRGLTEGNIRGDQFLAIGNFEKGSLQIGRIILPRSFWSSLTFSF